MKKFAKILGFLGFFVTLATAQIGTAWADGQYCGYGYDGYYGLGRTLDDCNKCAEDFSSYPNSTGGYNFSGDLCYSACSGTCIDANSSFQAGGTYGIPATSTFFVYKLNNGTQNSLLNINGLTCGNIGNYCAEVFDCGKNACSANWKTINFVDHNNNPLGTLYIVYGMIWSTQQTTACNNCAQDSRNYAVFYPVFQTPTAPTREGYTFLGYSDSQTGGIIRIGPDHNNMYGKLNYNNATNISGISGNTITLYARYENAGCAQNYWYNSQTDECIPCAEGFTSPGGYGNQHTCTKSCSETCTQRHNSTDECAEGVTGFYSPIVPITGTEYEDNQGHCYDTNNIEILAPDNDLTEAHWCQWNCDGCKDEQCYTFVGGACEPKIWNAMYDCDDGANVITDTNHPESYGNYIIADFSCQGQNGQTFIGWTLGSGGIVYNHNDPEHDELTWGCGHQTFKPVFEDNCYEVSFDDETNGGHPSGYPASTPGTHTSFYKKYNNTAWYSDSKCSDKIEIGTGANQVNVIGHLPWKAHATFTGYYYETPTPNRQIFNASGNLTTGNNSGSDWTINGNTVLYAQYTCVDGYAPNANGDCVGDKIDVKYTCVSPVDGEPDTHTFNDDATYGAAYLVKSVGTGNHNVPCAFTGYELDNDYVWNLQDYSGNSTNPNGEYGPNETLSSADWQYITTTPLTEIEFILDKSLWHLKTYTVEYRCGTIKPDADVYTDSSATYGQTYNVAGQFDPFNGGNVTVQDFLDNNCKPNGGFGAWTFQNWTFTCAGANSGPYNTNDPTFGTWTYDSNNCYFTANWGQTDFVIILDQNGGTDGNPSDYLYTRKSIGVYLDSARTLEMLPDHEPNANPLTPPQKTINITIYPDSTHDGTGASFTYNGTIYGYNGANNYANIGENLDFMGYYQNITLNPEKYIDPYDGKGYITSDGIAAGKTYDENNTNDQRTWVAHWGTGTITLPSTATWAGHDFAGWTCVDDENTVVYSCGTNQSCQVTVSENITCTAQWSVACRSVSFDDTTNGEQNSPTNGGNNGRFSKVSGVTGWYDGTECGGTQITPSVIGRIPTKTNGHFIGYNTAVDGTGNEIFNVNGTVTDYGRDTWAPVDNVTLYAQYECDDPYHLDTDPTSETWGQCVACAPGTFYDQNETDPAKQCKNCNQYISDNGVAGAGAYTWTSRPPYNWSIKQCYRVCDGANDTQITCNVVGTVSMHSEMEQFLTGTLINGGTGKQISFYGNEFATDPNNRVNTCDANVGAINCPQGFLAGGASGANKLMAAAVDFYQDRDMDETYEQSGTRYIIGGRSLISGQYKLNNGFVWSQVVGDAQLEGNTEGNPGIISIIYPATFAPTVADPEHHTFTGYGYPENDPSQNLFVNSDYSLTSGSDGNAKGIIAFANANDYQNMSPIIANSNYTRNLYAKYTANPTYTLTYSCGQGGGTPSISPNPVENIYAGDRIVPAQPEGCTNYGNVQFKWWVVSNSGDQHLAGDDGAFNWGYTENKTFTAVWGNANTHSIIYNKIPTTNGNNITPNGNTLVRPDASTMPTQFECDNGTTNITGQPQLKNSDNVVIGTVIEWCKNSDLEECYLPLELQNSNCTDKNVYAKWECKDEDGYHLNESKDDCVPCPDDTVWNGSACAPANTFCPEGYPHTRSPYNWDINNCFKYCDKSCADIDIDGTYIFDATNMKQIAFYGNERNGETSVCDIDDAKYCPRVLEPRAESFRPKESLVTFKKMGNNGNAGTRYIVGNTHGASNGYFNDSSKWWSYIVGAGQKNPENFGGYTLVIYPTDTAPSPDSTPNPAFKGYFDGTDSNATQRVAAELGLDSSNSTSNNAIAFPQSPLSENQIGDRILYPQYCENGQEWNGSACTGTDYTVKYICGAHGMDVEGMSMENTATYGQAYKVAYSGAQKIAECNPDTGYVLKTNDNNKPVWKFNGNDIEYYTGEEFQWGSTISSPTFTAQYDCAAGYTANGDVNDGGNCVLGVFTVTYDCGIGTGGSAPDSDHPVSTNDTYNVLPNGTANGGVVNCNRAGQGFAGWKFSQNTGVNTYNAGDTITWQAGYGDETLTAQYRTCNSNEVLVNGVCYPKCNDTTCTEPTPQNSQSHCPTDYNPPYPNNVTCSYAWENISGYLDGGVCKYANGINQGQPINTGVCQETVVCNDSAYVWNSDPTVWACVPNTGITYNVQFKCNETDAAPISGYSFNVTYGQSITIPSNSACPRTGYSYSQWKATQYDNPATLEAQNSTRTIDWNYTHNETFIADWNDGNVYHVNLHAYSCDDSTQTGTFGNSGVQELWEKYGVNWYRTNVGGTLSNPITELTTQQLPTRSGWTFGGYNTLGGDQRVRYANGAWNVSPTTLITEDEEWCAIWSQCNPNEYWNNGVCVTCNTATNGDFPLGDANATSIYQCYRQCSICTPVCPQTEGVNYCEYGNNSNMNGNLYYPGTGTCQPNYEQNCPITVLHCLPGYTPNGNNTACVPNNYMITLNSHIDGFNGHASSPEVLYTKYGPNGGAYLDSAYTYLMNDERSLYAVPEKSADVILNGNGGNVIWNGYSSSTATLTATFDFQGFYPSVYGGSQYIFDTGYISTNGNIAAQQNQSNSTVWHAQWQDGSITLPDAQRQCYTFNGWWTDMYNGVSAGNANMPYTPTGATTNLYAHWTPGTYSITYHNGNAIYSGCSTTSYTFGNAFAINCLITPQAGSHKVFNGWCTNPELTAGCTQNPVISNTDCGDKDYYAWWGCESGYNMENGVCVPNASELCPATTLPNNSHAILVNGVPNDGGTQCIYTLKCDACIGCNSSLYTCYTNGNSATNDGIFTVIGNIGDANVLADVRCNPTEYDVYYRCDGNSQGYAAPTKAVYGQAYSVEYNPHNNANGVQLDCQSDNQLFNGWTFNGNNQTYYPGTPNYMINSWNYCNITPIFTASYGQCPAGEVYVPSLGQCKEECYVPCKVPTNGACPNDFDLTPTSTGVHAYCGTYDGQAPNPQGPGYYLYPAPHVNEACLHVHTSNEITPQQCTDVSVVYCVDSNGTQSSHYTWDWDMHQCKPRTYRVTLTSNNGIEGSNFVNKLYEQYNVGWSRYLDGEFTSTLNLSQSELPTARETCKVFDGYWNDTTINRMINATGYLSLPATTLTDNTQVWNAHYVNDPNAYTITFQCSNGTVASTQYGVVFNQGNVTAPAMSLCPGEAFTQWVSGNVTLNAGTIYPNWQYCSNMTFTPDVSNSAVWEVTLLPGDGTFDSNDIRKLYDAVNVGWYTNRDLSEQSRITQIDNDKVPTKQGANFVGYKNQNGDWRVNYSNGSGWDLPRTNDLSGHETWTAQYNLCQAGYYYQDGQCKLCPSGYTSDPTTATQPEHCYVQCETCVEPTCPTISHSTGCEFDHNNNENYPGYLFYSQYGQNKCVKRTFNYNFTETIMCNWCAICDEANGWIRDPNNCQVCVPSWQSNGHTIDLNSLRMTDFDGDPTGDDVEPVRLYTWPDRGVYLDSGRTRLMTVGASGNNPVGTPTTYGVVRFDPNGGTFNMDGYTYTNRYGDRYVYANFRGFYNSQTGSVIYIDNTGHITQSGDDWGRTAGYDVTWYAKWQYGTIGELPTPTRLGYTFTGWYDSISGGNPVYEDTRVERSMNVYARWEKAKYFVNLDKNGGQWGSDPVYKLWELYGTGWSTEEYGAFNSDLTLMESQRPSWPGNSKVFNGYWTARNNGTQQIRADGSVVDTTATVLTGDDTTWYAQYVDNTNKYTITFRCSENGEPLSGYTQRVQNGDNVRVPSKSACSNEGHTMTNWTGNHNTTFNAQDTEYMATWSGVFTNEDFTPTWNDGNVYRVTLDQNGATQQGVTDLYEKYGLWWSLNQNGNPQITFLSGSDLPSKTGFNFGGYADENDRPVGSYNPTNNKWNLPDNTTVSSNGIIWTAIWTPCTGGQYWDGNKCYQCPTGFTDNPSAVDNEDYCYGNCQYDCRDVCPSTNQLPEGMESCTPNTEGYPQPGIIYYGTRLQGCLPGGTYGNQPGVPNCESIITCKPGYHLVNGVCVEYVKTDIMLNPNGGTWASNVPSEYRYLYTIESTGVYRNSARTEEMTPDNNVSLHAIPSNGVSITLDANGGSVTWGGEPVEILNRSAVFEFLGFYDSQTPGFAAPYILPQEINGDTYAFITTGGQSAGMGYTTTPHTWYAQWNRSVTLPTPERQNYTFVGWTYNGELISNPWTVPGNTTNVTLIARWTKNNGAIVAYKCDDGNGGIGGTGYDTQHPAYFGENYNVLPNGIVNGGVVNCSKPANIALGRRYHEFEDWVFSGDYAHYDPGEINWTFNAANPTFNAHYKECPNGWYFDGSCKQCPNGYTNSDIDADSASKCYDNCSVQCTESCPQLGEPGVIGCIYPTPRPTTEGQEYYGSTCNAVAENCEVIGVYCQNGYVPTSDGLHCQEDEDNYHEITLDPNGGTVGQEKLYTIHNIGVYLDSARTRQMSAYNNYLTNLPQKNAVATFDCNPECSTPVSPVSVELVFNGYYERQSGGAKYINKFVDDGVAKGAITSDGNTAGKGYTANATWFAQWSGAAIGNSRWPENPVRPDACVTYSFVDWYTAANGGTPVSYNTPVSENVTWYAHWCESCPDGITNGSCSDAGCVARFTCNDGYAWDETQCQCVAATWLTLTYQPNGGTPDTDYTEDRYFGETFTTRDGNTYTKVGHIIAKWANVGVGGGSFPLLAHSYTYDYNGNTTLEPEWKQCTCTFNGNSGVESCDANIVTNNTCTPDVVCKPGYVNGHYTCTNEHLETCTAMCDICPAGTYQNGDQCSPCTGNNVSAAGATQCEPCDPGYTANAEHTQCVGNPITINWDENGGNAISNGSCVYGQTLTLANAPEHSNRAMQFLGWKLFTGDSNYPAGTNVMCTYDNVGVYSGTSTAIQAQWNECQCSDQLNPHVVCQPVIVDDVCRHIYWCDSVGYNIVGDDYSNISPYCDPKTFDVTYNCGVGATGTPLISADTATYDDTYIVKNAGGVNCQKVGFNFVGWLFDGDNYLHQADDRITWTYTSNKTFTAQYSQCAAGEVWVNGACEPCTCPQENWGAGVTQCVASPSSTSTCSALVSCNSGYYHPQGNCNGATCSAQCDQIQSNAIYVCGDGATGNPPATETMNYGAPHTVKGQASCAKSGYTFNGWNFTGTNGNYNPGATVQWDYGTDQTFTGNWCENCVQPDHGECSLNASVAGMCSYNCNCNAGYTLVGGVCTAHPVCERSEYNITYQPNGGMNNGVLGQPVIQDVTYGVGFTTKDGTIFTMENSIITAWDHVDGGNYPDLNAWYQYNTVGDTVLDAHWKQCTCTLGTGAESCGTLSTAGNACNWTNPVCQNGYVSPNMQCSGTGNTNCTLTCGECAEGEIIVDGQCVPCTCTTGTGAASCTPGATANNTCTAVGQCMVGYGNENGNANVVCNGTNCVVSYNECGDGWVSNENCQCEICPANTYQSGNTCVPCQNGYTSPAGSSSADACVPGAHTIHYLSNNGMNQTYDQSVTYGQSFMTEGGTRFMKVNNIMTHWNVESGPSNTFTNGAATLSGNYTYGDTTDTTLSAQWAQCECDAPNCNTYATDLNTCACNATCPTGYTYGGCECDGTVCEPICTLGGSNAIYKCGTGIGTGYSTYVNYGVTHTILTNAFVGCYRDNSTFAGWAFNGDNNIYFDNVGATVTWDYTTDKEFEARWCSNCPVVEHGTNLLTIPEPGLCRCDLTCNTGYHVENGACEPNVYPNENGITYKPNGGTPNQNYTQSVTYDAPFTTLGAVYSKARHILNSWDVESGGAGTFNGTAALNTTYTYHTDGATSLLAKWIECGINEISLDNRCQQCQCTDNNAGVTSCETSATNNDTCSCSGECAAGYINAGCNCNGTNCTQSCTKCADNQVSVNNVCEDCVCEKNIDGIEGIISGCGFVSNNGNTCNWNPTTCRLGYGNPDLTCTETDHNNNCTASCTICPAGTYGDNGVECKPCPEGKTSLAGATSIRECFIDPNSCAPDEHIEHGECVSNTRACSIPDATSAVRIWNPAIGTYGPCTVEVDGCNSGYHVSGNVCVKDTEACTVEHGHGEHDWNGTSWGACGDVVCDPGYEPNSDYTACVECSNRRVNGDIAVSGYIYECEIAACMYQGQKYALQNGECVPICENASDETGTKVWDEGTKKCIRTCNPGYKMW